MTSLEWNNAYVEVAHEALIREWKTLRKWLDEDRESERVRSRITVAARRWRVRACARANRNLTPEEWALYFGDEPYRETCPIQTQ